MFEILGTFPQWMTMIFTLGGVVVAAEGLRTWREKLRAEGRHATAMEVATAVGNLHVEFFNNRAPLIQQWEYRREGDNDAKLPPGELYRRALSGRHAQLQTPLMAAHNMKGKALAILGADCADALEAYTRKAMTLEATWNHYVRLLEMGREVDAKELRLAEENSFAPVRGATDQLSREFQDCFEVVIHKLRRDLQVG